MASAAQAPNRSMDYCGTRITVGPDGQLSIEPAPDVHTSALPGHLVTFAIEKQRRIAKYEPDLPLNDVMIRSGCQFKPWGADTAEAKVSATRHRAMRATTVFAEEFLMAIHEFHHPSATQEEHAQWARKCPRALGDTKSATDANRLPAQTLYEAIQHSAVVRFVAVHSVYFTDTASAALGCLIDQITGPKGIGPISRNPPSFELPAGDREAEDNPYVAFVRTVDGGIGAVVQDALDELSVLAAGDGADNAENFHRTIAPIASVLDLYGTSARGDRVPLRWDAIHTLGFAFPEPTPDDPPITPDRQRLSDLLAFLSPVQDALDLCE